MRLEPLPSVLLSKERSSRLLAQSYELIREHRNQEADEILDALLIAEPQNVEAWEAFMQLRRDPNDLHWLKQRVMYTPELSDADKQDILLYYDFLLRRLVQSEQPVEIKTAAPIYSPSSEFIIPKADGNQGRSFEIATQTALVSGRPRTIVFEYEDDLSQLSDQIIQPIGANIRRRSTEFQIATGSKLTIGLGLMLVAMLGLGLIVHNQFFGYWILLACIITLLSWFLNYIKAD